MVRHSGQEPAATCRPCKSPFPRSSMARHLATCLARNASTSKREPADALHLVVEGESPATLSTYWLHLLARADATLWDVDGFLRTTWLECCGHLSAFEVRGRRFESDPDDEYGPPAESMKEARLSAVFRRPVVWSYEYDFGSTTQLRLRVMGRRDAAMTKRAKVLLLARNEPPDLGCGTCGRSASCVCTAGCEGEAALVCRACAPGHECGEEMLSALVNSPRTGVCGYPIEPPENERGGRVVGE